MTRDEILAMKPGRELDALVAREIFGVQNPDPLWRPSEDISAAWEVVQEMREKGFDFAFETLNDSLKAGGDLYHARFYRRYEGDYGEYDSDISEADAICKAALLAVMEG